MSFLKSKGAPFGAVNGSGFRPILWLKSHTRRERPMLALTRRWRVAGAFMRKVAFVSVAFAAFAAAPAMADEMTMPASPSLYSKTPMMGTYYDWTGFYFGGHVGYGWSNTDTTTINTATGACLLYTSPSPRD